MPSFNVTSPDGRTFKVTAPAGATQEQIIAYAQQNMPAADPKTDVQSPAEAAAIAVGRWVDRRASGLRAAVPESVRKAVDSVGSALGMAAPPSIDKADIADSEARYQKVADQFPKATFAGDLAANMTAINPLSMGIMAGLEIGTPEERAIRAATSYGAGKVGEKVGGWAAGKFADRAAAKAAERGAAQSNNAVRDATLKQAQAAGYVLPPSQVNPTVANRVAEGFAGKLTTAQQASAKNQSVTNSLVRKELGLPDDVPLVPETFQAVRQAAHAQGYAPLEAFGTVKADKTYAEYLLKQGEAYDKATGGMASLRIPEVESIIRDANKEAFDSATIVPFLRNLREQGFANKGFAQDAKTKALGNAQIKIATAIEDLTERNLAAAGQKELLTNFREARKLMAKTFTVEKAVNQATGNVNAGKLARELDKGKPLTGGIRDAAIAARAFPAATKENLTSMPGVSPLDYMGAGLLSGAVGSPLGMLTAVSRPMVRSGILSDVYQKSMVNPPNYSASAFEKLLKKAGDSPEAMQRIGGLLGLSGLQSFR